MQAAEKLPVLRIVAASYAFVLLNGRDFLRVVALPFVAIAALDILFGINAPEYGPEDGGLPPLDISMLFALALELFVTVTVLVAWHRRVLLGEDGLPPGFPLAMGAREGRFFVRLVGVTLAVLVFHTFAGAGFAAFIEGESAAMRVLGIAGLVGVGFADLYLAGRLLLILPATAVDERFNFGKAWRVSKGNGWRLALAWFLTVLPILAIQLVIYLLIIFSESREFLIGAAVAIDALSLINMALGATVLSLCFVHLYPGREDEQAPY